MTRKQLLGAGALVVSFAAIGMALVAGVSEGNDTGTSFGAQFDAAARDGLIAVALVLVALVLGAAAWATRRGRVLGLAAVGLALVAIPIGIVVMDALPSTS